MGCAAVKGSELMVIAAEGCTNDLIWSRSKLRAA
jgi:hypothetical protein